MIAGQLEIMMSADIARIADDMRKVQSTVGGAMTKVESAVGSAKTALASLGIGLGIGAIVTYVKGLVDAGEQMQKMSERTGIAVGELSRLKFAANLGEVEFGALAKAVGFFNVKTVEATDQTSKQAQMFKALGVDITKGPNEALMQFAQRASAIDDAAVKTAVFRAAFGKVGDELIPVMKNLKETTDLAKRLGVTMSEETAEAAARLNDNLRALKVQADAFTVKKMDPMISAFATITDNIIKAAEKGEKWLGILEEIAKVSVATGATTLKGSGGISGMIGSAYDWAAGKMFSEKPTTLGEILAAKGAPKITGSTPDSKELAKILSGASGSKAGGAGKADDNGLKEYLRIFGMTEDDKGAWQKVLSDMDKVKLDAANKEQAEEQALRAKGLADYAAYVDAMFEKANEKAVQEAKLNKKVSGEITEFWKKAAHGMQSSMSDFFFDIMQGKLTDLGTSFKRMIDRMVADYLAAQAATALFGKDFGKGGEMGGYLGKAMDWIKLASAASSSGTQPAAPVETRAFAANGADWMVGGNGGTDSQVVNFHATPGERVIVQTPAQQQSGGSVVVHNNFTVNGATDRRSRAQIAAAAGEGVQRAMARNT